MDQDELDRYADAIAAVESEGSGGYRAIGPPTRTGDRAIGRYQVMASNVPQWSYEATGRAMTPQEFYASPEAQDAVFKHRFGSYVDQHGNPYDAASMWFTGRPLSRGGSSSDGYINGYTYVNRFAHALANPGPARGGDKVDFASYGIAPEKDAAGGAGGQPASGSASTQLIDFAAFGASPDAAQANPTDGPQGDASAPPQGDGSSNPMAFTGGGPTNIPGFPPVSQQPMSAPSAPPQSPATTGTSPASGPVSAPPQSSAPTTYGYGGSDGTAMVGGRPGQEIDLSQYGYQ